MADNVVSERMGLCYQDVEKLLHKQVHRLVGNGIAYNKEQAVSDANLAFVMAYHNYDSSRAQFNTHVGYRVLMRIKTEFRKLCKKPRPLTFSELDENGQNQVAMKLSVKPHKVEKERPEWSDLLSKDAREVVDLVLNSPKDIIMMVDEKGNNSANSYRSSIKEYLSGIGWNKRRISEAFDEIKDVLQVEK